MSTMIPWAELVNHENVEVTYDCFVSGEEESDAKIKIENYRKMKDPEEEPDSDSSGISSDDDEELYEDLERIEKRQSQKIKEKIRKIEERKSKREKEDESIEG